MAQSTFDYRLFHLFPVERFEAVMLRGGHNDVYNPFVKDEFVRRLHKDMGGVAASGTLMSLFINGQHKAFYNPTERLDHDFFRTWYNSDKEWDVITQRDVRNGDSVEWNNMHQLLPQQYLTLAANYQKALQMDRHVDDFIDYLIIQLCCGNWDWPKNNWTAARERSANANWRILPVGRGGLLEIRQLSMTGFDDMPNSTPAGDPSSRPYRSLKANPDFKQAFADRIQKALLRRRRPDGAQLRMRWFHQLRRDMAQVLPGMNQFVANTWIPNRQQHHDEHLHAEGFFWLQGPRLALMDDRSGADMSADGATADHCQSDGSGTIWYTINGADPRLPVAPDQTTTVLVAEMRRKACSCRAPISLSLDRRGTSLQ